MLNKLFIKLQYPVQIESLVTNQITFSENPKQNLLQILGDSYIHDSILKELNPYISLLFDLRTTFPYVIQLEEVKTTINNSQLAKQRMMQLLYKLNPNRKNKLESIYKNQNQYLKLLFIAEDNLNNSRINLNRTISLRFTSFKGDNMDTSIDKTGDFYMEILVTLYNIIVVCYYLFRLSIKEIKKSKSNKEKDAQYINAKTYLFKGLEMIELALNYVQKFEDMNIELSLDNSRLFFTFLTCYFNALIYEIQVYNSNIINKKEQYNTDIPEYFILASRYYKKAYDILKDNLKDINNTFLQRNMDYYLFSSKFCEFQAYCEKYEILMKEKQYNKADGYLFMAKKTAEEIVKDPKFEKLVNVNDPKAKNDKYHRFMQQKKLISEKKPKSSNIEMYLNNNTNLQIKPKDDRKITCHIIKSTTQKPAFDYFKLNVEIINSLISHVQNFMSYLKQGIELICKNRNDLQNKYQIDGQMAAFQHQNDVYKSIIVVKLDQFFNEKSGIISTTQEFKDLWEKFMSKLQQAIEISEKNSKKIINLGISVNDKGDLNILQSLKKKLQDIWPNDQLETDIDNFLSELINQYNSKDVILQNLQEKLSCNTPGKTSTFDDNAKDTLDGLSDYMDMLDVNLIKLKDSFARLNIEQYVYKTLKSEEMNSLIKLAYLEWKKNQVLKNELINEIAYTLFKTKINVIELEKQYIHNKDIYNIIQIIEEKFSLLQSKQMNHEEMSIIQEFNSKIDSFLNFHEKIKMKLMELKTLQDEIEISCFKYEHYDKLNLDRSVFESMLYDSQKVSIIFDLKEVEDSQVDNQKSNEPYENIIDESIENLLVNNSNSNNDNNSDYIIIESKEIQEQNQEQEEQVKEEEEKVQEQDDNQDRIMMMMN